MKDRVYYLRDMKGGDKVGNIVIGVRRSAIPDCVYVRVSLGFILIVNTKFLTYLGKL